MPACCKRARRRGEAEARTSFGRQPEDVSVADAKEFSRSTFAWSLRRADSSLFG